MSYHQPPYPYYPNQPHPQSSSIQMIIQQLDKAFKNVNKVCEDYFQRKQRLMPVNQPQNTKDQRNFNNYKGQNRSINIDQLQQQNSSQILSKLQNKQQFVEEWDQQFKLQQKNKLLKEEGQLEFQNFNPISNKSGQNNSDHVNWNSWKQKVSSPPQNRFFSVSQDNKSLVLPPSGYKKLGVPPNTYTYSKQSIVQKSFKKQNIPAPPKQPLSPYFAFYKQKKDLIRQQFPQLSITQTASAAAKVWKSLSDSEKGPYLNAYFEQKRKYDHQLRQYAQKYPNYKQLIKKATNNGKK